MAVKLDEINYPLVRRLGEIAEKHYIEKEYLTAFLIQFQILEWTLRIAIAILLTKRGLSDEKAIKTAEEIKTFGGLMHRFLQLSNEKKRYERLNKIREKRNELIHGIFTLPNEETIYRMAKEICEKAEKLKDELKENYFPKDSNNDEQ